MSNLSMRAQTFAEIQTFLVEGATDLFNSYGMPVAASSVGDAVLEGPAIMATIGYTSASICGSLILLTSPEVVDRLRPRDVVGTPPEEVLKDVLAEFANMILGRVKNQLASRQVEPQLSIPVASFGEHLDVPSPRSGISAWHTFTGSAGSISVRFDASFVPEFSLAPQSMPSTSLPPGQTLYFFDSSEVES